MTDADALHHAVESSIRNERRKGILMTIVAAIFIAGGVVIFCVMGALWLAGSIILFSGAVLLVGIFKIARPAKDLPVAARIIGCFGMAATGAVLILSGLPGTHDLGPRQAAALPVGILAVIFFGGGGVLALLRQIRRRRWKKGDRGGRRI